MCRLDSAIAEALWLHCPCHRHPVPSRSRQLHRVLQQLRLHRTSTDGVFGRASHHSGVAPRKADGRSCARSVSGPIPHRQRRFRIRGSRGRFRRDLVGTRLIGAFIATLGLPEFNPVNEEVRRRLAGAFGSGYDYTYLYPGIRKVVQAAGRVIRTTPTVELCTSSTTDSLGPRFCACFPVGGELIARRGEPQEQHH